MPVPFNGVYLTKIDVKKNEVVRNWVSITNPGYYDISVDAGDNPPLSSYLPSAATLPLGFVGLVISSGYDISQYYRVEEQIILQTTTLTDLTFNGVLSFYYAWEVIPATTYQLTSLPPPSYTYYNQVARITGTKSWKSTSDTNWDISVDAGNNPPLPSFLPPASGYAEGTIGRVVAPAEYGGTAYYIVSQYTYYRCVVK